MIVVTYCSYDGSKREFTIAVTIPILIDVVGRTGRNVESWRTRVFVSFRGCKGSKSTVESNMRRLRSTD